MSFLILILTCVFLFIGTIGLTSWLTRFRMKRYQTVAKSSFCPIESTVAFVFALISLPLFLLLNPMMGMVSVLVLFALVIAFLYTEARFSGSLLLGTQYILCLIGTCLIPQNGQLFQTLPVFVTIPVLAFVWLALVRLTVFADKIPYFSSLLITVLGLFFILCGLLGVLPAFITYISLLLCVISFALIGTMRVWTQELKLGTFGALILGFIVGGMLSYIASFGFIEIPAILYAYIILEWFFVSIASVRLFLGYKKGDSISLFEQIWNEDLNRQKLVRFTGFCFVLLSLLSVILLTQNSLSAFSVVFIVSFILVGMVVRFRNWGTPVPSYRDIFRDIGAGLGALKKEVVGSEKSDISQTSSPKKGRKKK